MKNRGTLMTAFFAALAAGWTGGSAGAADLGDGFALESGDAALDGAYRKALGVITSDVKDGKFLAGQNWAQVWTRDTSYSVELACALLHPDVSRTTLLGLTQEVEGIGECWYQDKCGHFAGWPNLTDAIVGAQGAWSLYLVTGDRSLVKPIYERTLRSLQRAERDAFNKELGLFGGCSTFMESNSGYPRKYAMKGEMIAKTCALSTCLLHHRGYQVAAAAGRVLGLDVGALEEKAERLKKAINAKLWMPDKGYYAYYLDESGKLNKNMEGMGEALAILNGVADAEKAKQILQKTPVTPWGIPCQWPQYPEWMDYKKGDADYYHNGMIWPFVQGYWAWAATTMKDTEIFARELDALLRLAAKSDTFMEFYRPEDGAPDGSPRQLWSASGFLSMVYHGLFGMSFEQGGIRFAPVVPAPSKEMKLTGVKYRAAVLNLTVRGNGTRVTAFRLDGATKTDPFFDGTLQGTHTVEIEMAR